MPFWPLWFDGTAALAFWDGPSKGILVIPSWIGGGAVADTDVDDSEKNECLRLGDGKSPSAYSSSACSEENVTNSCASLIEFAESIEEYPNVTVPNNSNQVMQTSVITKNND